MNTAAAFEHGTDDTGHDNMGGEQLALAPDAVEVRRNGGLAAVIGAGASAVAIAYLSRATQTGAVLDWLLFVVMGSVAAVYLRSFVDARTPLLVADAQGVRIRLGHTWRGLPWGALYAVQHTPRRGLVRDGCLVLEPRNPAKALAELDASGRRASALNRQLFGAPFAVPLGLSTRVSGAVPDLTAALSALAAGDARVVEVEADAAPVARMDTDPPMQAEPAARRLHLRDPRPVLATLIDAVAARTPRFPRTGDDAVHTEETVELPGVLASATPSPLRQTRSGSRAEVTRDVVRGSAALDLASDDEATRHDVPEARELRRHGSVNLVEETLAWGARVLPIAKARDSVEPLVIDEFALEPAADPVIGPEIMAARTRIGLTVDQLAERTRIRPHVIESIEVDDFAPCGGDFYARGHLRTLARILGVDVAPLLASYDERYADAPINPRRVFEAELATGINGSIRGTRGGPNWTLLVGVVMAVILLWSIARLVMDEPPQVTRDAPALNGSLGLANHYIQAESPTPVRAVFTATGRVHLVVRDGEGEIVYTGDLESGQTVRRHVVPPVKVKSSDGGAITAVVDGRDQGTLGEAGTPSRSTFVAR